MTRTEVARHGRRAEDGRDGMEASGIDEGHEAEHSKRRLSKLNKSMHRAMF
ncbi:hypothetical protein SH501x_000971 [Pirellulaceae bacterium SH501]